MRGLLIFAVLSALLAVILGAFAAHGLKTMLDSAMLSAFETGVRYQMYHALGLLALPAVTPYGDKRCLVGAGIFFCIGTVLFSGSLYLLTTLSLTALGPVTPLGGLSFMIGWLMVLVALIRGEKA